jgi:hypothetical protein
LLGIGIGLVFATAFKSWQIRDKAERVRFYQEYDRATRISDQLAAKKRAEEPKEEEEDAEAEGGEEEAEAA